MSYYIRSKSKKLWSVTINLPLKFKNLVNIQELRLRILSGIFLIIIFFGLYTLGNPFFSLFFVLIFSPLFYEFDFLSYNGFKKNKIFKILIFQLLLLFFFISKLYEFDIIAKYSNFLVLLTICLSINVFFFKNYINLLAFFISNVILLSFFSLINILLLPDGLNYFFYLVILVSTMDIFAYLGGKTLGNKKIAPKISKGKTIEGTLIGLGFTIIMSLLIKHLINFNFVQALIAGILISFFAFWGDLLESYFKRNIGIKDSGKLIPGHGGLLDRFDGYFLILPLYNIYLLF